MFYVNKNSKYDFLFFFYYCFCAYDPQRIIMKRMSMAYAYQVRTHSEPLEREKKKKETGKEQEKASNFKCSIDFQPLLKLVKQSFLVGKKCCAKTQITAAK